MCVYDMCVCVYVFAIAVLPPDAASGGKEGGQPVDHRVGGIGGGEDGVIQDHSQVRRTGRLADLAG